jgi:hypothetical protein
MRRGKPPNVTGVRMDTRKHTRHCLRPSAEIVSRLLDTGDEYGPDEFRVDYLALIAARFAEDPRPFDQLAQRARHQEVYLGCSCPTKKNPDIRHCHTWLALEFMAERYPDLAVVFPAAPPRAD